MSIDLANFEELTKSAVTHFWQSRQRAQQRQAESGKLDQGQRYSPEVHSPIRETSAHFAILPEFRNSSYAQRYELLCKKLIQERLYDAATLLLSPADIGLQGAYSELSQMIGIRRWATALASHVAAAATN